MNASNYLSIIAVIVAFVSMCAQVYVGKKDHGQNVYQHVTTLFNNINTPFLEYPELRPYFYEGKDPKDLSATDYQRATVIAEMILDTFEWVEHDIVKARPEDKVSWRDFMSSVYQSSSLVSDFHECNPSWHPLFDTLLHTRKVK